MKKRDLEQTKQGFKKKASLVYRVLGYNIVDQPDMHTTRTPTKANATDYFVTDAARLTGCKTLPECAKL